MDFITYRQHFFFWKHNIVHFFFLILKNTFNKKFILSVDNDIAHGRSTAISVSVHEWNKLTNSKIDGKEREQMKLFFLIWVFPKALAFKNVLTWVTCIYMKNYATTSLLLITLGKAILVIISYYSKEKSNSFVRSFLSSEGWEKKRPMSHIAHQRFLFLWWS